MAEPFLGEIKLFGFGFTPQPDTWAPCDGSLISVNENPSLFALIGSTYGGDGRTTFALPDLRGRAPLHRGTLSGERYLLGQRGGFENITLTSATMPAHSHALNASSSPGDQSIPTGQIPADSQATPAYVSPTQLTQMAGQAITFTGGNEAHENMQPFLVLNFCIAIKGTFPSRN